MKTQTQRVFFFNLEFFYHFMVKKNIYQHNTCILLNILPINKCFILDKRVTLPHYFTQSLMVTTFFSQLFLLLLLFFYKFIYLFIFGCVGPSFLRVGFLQLRQAGSTLRCGAWASHCGDLFSCCRAWALGTWASVVVARGLSSCGSWAVECRLSSCDARAQLLCSMWDFPRPGLEPVSSALAGGFLTTAPPGKSCYFLLYSLNVSKLYADLILPDFTPQIF